MERRKLLLLRAALQSAGGVLTTVTGVSPLSLVNAVAHSMISLTQYGKCEQIGTPTLDAAPLMCNNGVLRYGALGDNLLDPAAANTILGYYINKADGERKAAASNFMFAGYMPVEAGKTYVAYGRRKSDNDLSDYNRIAWYDSEKTWIAGADYTQNRIAVATAPENAAYALFSCNPSGSTTVTVTQELVDGYNWMFAEGTAEITPFVPFEGGIYADGTDEVLTVSKVDTYTAVDGQGTYVTPGSAANRIYKYIGDTDGDYTISVSTDYDFIVQYRKPADNTLPVSSYGNEGSWENGTATVTLDKGAEFGYGISIRLHDSPNGNIAPGDFDGTITIVHNSTVQTVTDIPMLLSVGDYADEVELVGGLLTRNCAVIVLTGNEDWLTSSSDPSKHYCHFTSAIYGDAPTMAPLCTHFTPAATPTWGGLAPGEILWERIVSESRHDLDIYTDGIGRDDFKALLAAQYAAGTPVMVVVPQAAATGQVTPQPLSTAKGTNTVSVTANVSGIELEVKHMAAS